MSRPSQATYDLDRYLPSLEQYIPWPMEDDAFLHADNGHGPSSPSTISPRLQAHVDESLLPPSLSSPLSDLETSLTEVAVIGQAPASSQAATSNQTPTVDGDLPIAPSWLESQENWPETAEHVLRTFMTQHGFYNYYGTKATSRRQLGEVTSELRGLFNTDQWNEAVHGELLQKKVLNKMHRIRREIQRDALAEFRVALGKLEQVQHLAALHLVIETVGLNLARTVMDAVVEDH